MTVREALRHGAAMLERAGVGNPALDARLLLAHAAGLTREALLRDPSRTIDANGYQALLNRRAAREPVALILGRQEFWSLDFAVSPATLVPRADSETLIEAAIATLPRPGVRRILDLGTGTGCLLLAALSEYRDAWGLGIDLHPEAATLARHNAATLQLADRAVFIAGSWHTAVQGRFDLILCNPPYLRDGEWDGIMPEVREHEPRRALLAGSDGLDAYRAVLAGLKDRLSPGGAGVIELGIGQAEAVTRLAHEAGFREATTRADLAGVPRALVLRA